jgi:hypothetical protein
MADFIEEYIARGRARSAMTPPNGEKVLWWDEHLGVAVLQVFGPHAQTGTVCLRCWCPIEGHLFHLASPIPGGVEQFFEMHGDDLMPFIDRITPATKRQ